MDARSSFRPVLLVVLLALAPAACTGAASPSPSASPPASAQPSAASPSALSPSVSPSASASPTASQGACGPSPSSCASPSPTAAASVASCPSRLLRTTLAADRLVGIKLTTGPDSDRVQFVLSASSSPPPSEHSVEVTTSGGPFVADPSGLPLQVAGTRFVVVIFRGMTIADAAGTPVYTGPASFSQPGPGVRSVVQQSAYEGVTSWIVGYDATTCATAEDGSGAVTLVILHND